MLDWLSEKKEGKEKIWMMANLDLETLMKKPLLSLYYKTTYEKLYLPFVL